MPDTKSNLEEQFQNDVNQLAFDLIKYFGLKYSLHEKNKEHHLIRWLDFRLRYIDPKPRLIFFSDRFPKYLPSETKKAFDHLLNLIKKGRDINLYQSTSLFYHHDTNDKKRQNRTDLLWASWAIHHLHLNYEYDTDGFIERLGWLLFCIVD